MTVLNKEIEKKKKKNIIEKEEEYSSEPSIDRVLMMKSKGNMICSEAGEITEQESGESSEEIESPRSVGGFSGRRNKQKELVHSQILRIREEDLHLGEDLGESNNSNISINNSGFSLNVVVFSRPILPCSPLGGGNPDKNVRALH
ncbi:hypothetical protein CsatB_021676 [Cannabis sativa]|uniref:Uncharacterized protein n=1 Tax=Cannabis sativa TaxID=3483 RepID=A0A803QMC3_CANSA